MFNNQPSKATMKSPAKPTGYVIYQGPSLLNGEPIVVIAIIQKSRNAKTGNMVQTYILPDNGLSPLENVKNLQDESVCGICPHRRGKGGSCYVNLGRGPNQVWKTYNKGNYPVSLEIASELCKDRIVRLGTYGDPAAVPRIVWVSLLENANGHSGYSHQWKNGKADTIKDLVMASVDIPEDYKVAKSLGYRTFRVRLQNEPLLSGEFICPASHEGNKRKLCVNCKACDGNSNPERNQANVAIIVHGILANRFENSRVTV